MQPPLSLRYTGARQGIAGVGWSLGGLSTIARCASTKAVDGLSRHVLHHNIDKLCLDGQRLIQTDASGAPLPFPQTNDAAAVAANGVREYRIEADHSIRIRAHGSNSTGGPAYFTVKTANGIVREYGAAPTNPQTGLVNPVVNSDNSAAGMGFSIAWPLVRVTDAAGNYMQYTYSVNQVPAVTYTDSNGSVAPGMGWPTGSEWVLSRIDYSGNQASTGPTNSVVLTYSDRTLFNGARSLSFEAGHVQLSTKLLSKVETFAGGTGGAALTRRVKLQYGAGPSTGRDILQGIAECIVNSSATEVCTPATSFAYSPGGSAMDIDNSPLVDASGNPNGLDTIVLDDNPWTQTYSSGCNCSFAAISRGTIMGDFNSDGRTDLLRWSSTASDNRLFLSEGVKNYKAVPIGTGAGQFNLTSARLKGVYDPLLRGPQTPDSCVLTSVLDLNRDARDDLLVVPTANGPDAYGKSFCPAASAAYMYLSNGDGSFNRQLIRDAATQQAIPLNRTPGVDPVGNGQYISDYANYIVGDFDDDGLPDILALTAQYAALVTDSPYPGLWCLTSYTNCSTTLWLGNGDGSFRKTPTPGFGPIASMADHTLNGNWVPYIVPSLNNSATDFRGNGIQGLVLPAFVGWPRATAPSTLAYVGETRLNGPITGAIFTLNGGQPDPCNVIWGYFRGDVVNDGICREDGTLLMRKAVDANGYVTWGYRQTYTPGASQFFSPSTTAQFFTADIDGDGRTDLLINGIYFRSLGNGGFSHSAAPFSGQMGNNFGNYFKNFLGTGGAEYLATYWSQMQWGIVTAGRNTFYSKVDPLPPDQLLSVTTPTGIKTTLTYTNLSNPAVYASDMGTVNAGAYPSFDVTPSINVVTKVSTDTGVGTAKAASEFGYAGFKVEPQGRGFLGFREIRQQVDAPDGVSKLTSVKQLVQKHPHIGSVAVSETYLGALSAMNAPQTGTRVSRVENIYCDTYAAAGAENSATVTAPCPVSGKLSRPYLFKSVQSGVDLAGYATPTTTTTQRYSGGYLSSVVVQTQGSGPAGTESFSKQTDYQYFPDDILNDNWKVGRVKRATTNSTVPNSLSAIPTTPGSQPKAGATTGQ
ncbi:hypothetical protein J2X21_004573 [Kinneretia asaccharophila]|uniref:Insecticide toxin TcdB middle/N-terminal domain-containing protein n=2 Tax=Roseateles asaccharophilus TaxID=582607 RepID=A0ABU2ADX6_9BURK|nr:hypothetical protein [Roseateles asaccharophilus]